MADALPSDAKMQAFLELQVDKAEDLTLLSRTILKEGLAKKFKLSTEQRALLDSDDHYKKSIKGWINDAVVGGCWQVGDGVLVELTDCLLLDHARQRGRKQTPSQAPLRKQTSS